jgi:osmotically inducible protein OsmC
MPTRTASAKWTGGLKGGNGSFSTQTGLSSTFNFSTRFGEEPGSNPEELLAASDAACFSMALSGGLEKAGFAPTSIETKAACTVEKVGEGFKVTRMQLTTTAIVPGIDDAKFQAIAQATKDGCPISSAIKGNVQIDLEATLKQA